MDWHKDRLIWLILLLVKWAGDLLLQRQRSPASAISSELRSCSVGSGVLLRKELPRWQWLRALAPRWSVCTETTAQKLLCTDCTPPLKAITLLVPVTYLDRLLQNLTALRPSDFTEAMQENARTSKGKHSYTYRGNKPARKGAVWWIRIWYWWTKPFVFCTVFGT